MNTIDNKFPRSLLQNSVEVRKSYFNNRTISHPRLEAAKEHVLSLIDNTGEPDVLIVTGPTGVGKTTLAAKLEDKLLERSMARMESDKYHLPVIKIVAVPPGKDKKFDWKDFYIRWLHALNEPCASQKQLFEEHIYMEQPISPFYSMNTVAALRRAVEKTMKMRGTKALIIDEANHLLMVDPKLMGLQFEIIKSLSQKCDATIVLIGTYDLLQIREQSAQLVRRGHVVHMARYDDYNAADKRSFKNALFSFQLQMPFEIEPNLVANFNHYYLKSAGCIGVLKDWLDNAVNDGLDKGLKTLTWDFIVQHALSNKNIQTILKEAFDGEAKLKDIDVRVLRDMLKTQHEKLGEITAKPNGDEPPILITTDQEPLPKLPPKKKSVRGQVGKRNPTRDSTEVQYGLPL